MTAEAEPEVARALEAAVGEVATLRAQLTTLQVDERRAVAELTTQVERLTARQQALAVDRSTMLARIAKLEEGTRVSLTARDRARKVAQALLRLVLSLFGFLGLLVFSTTGASFLEVVAALAVQVGAVWFLSDLVDRKEFGA